MGSEQVTDDFDEPARSGPRTRAAVTADRPAIQPTQRAAFGVRLWLALMFAAIRIITGTSVYVFVSDSSESAARAAAPTSPRAGPSGSRRRSRRAPGHLTKANASAARRCCSDAASDSFRAWVFAATARRGRRSTLVSRGVVELSATDVPGGEAAFRAATGKRVNSDLPGDET